MSPPAPRRSRSRDQGAACRRHLKRRTRHLGAEALEARTLLPNLALLLVALAWASIDPRPTIAAGLYAAPTLLGYLPILLFRTPGIGVWGVIIPLTIAAVTGILLGIGGARAQRLSRL